MESRREVCARTQEEVAELLSASLGCKVSPRTIAKLERRAFRKLRANPQARLLLRYMARQSAQPLGSTIEPDVLRMLGSTPDDASFLTISGFAPNL